MVIYVRVDEWWKKNTIYIHIMDEVEGQSRTMKCSKECQYNQTTRRFEETSQ